MNIDIYFEIFSKPYNDYWEYLVQIVSLNLNFEIEKQISSNVIDEFFEDYIL